MPSSAPRLVLVIPQQHFDPAWQRHPDEYIEFRENMLLKAFRIMELYPEWTWSFDQKIVLEDFLDRFPEMEERVRAGIRGGRIELVGGQITIPDANLPGDEAQVRQHLYGKRWMEKEFGTEVVVAWYYDTFGMHPQVPQILTKCGFRYLHAIRYCHEELELPFYWKGLDGSAILSHSRDYNHNSWDYQFIDGALDRIRDLKHELKFMVDRFIPVESYPDYFHQPNEAPVLWYEPHSEEEMPSYRVAQMARKWNVEQKEFEFRFGIPREYFEGILASGWEIKTFEGDMNPEFTGCYTSRHWHKQRARRAENDLAVAEQLSIFAFRAGFEPDAPRRRRAWEDLCLMQHHDGITGCHVDSVDHFIREKLDFALNTAAQETDRALETLLEPAPGTVAVYNPLPWTRSAVVEWPKEAGGAPSCPARRDGRGGVEALVPDLPSLGWAEVPVAPEPPAPPVAIERIESPFYEVVPGEAGLASLKIKGDGAELALPGRLFGELWLEEDQGNLYFETLTENRVGAAQSENLTRAMARDALADTLRWSGRLAAPWCDGVLEWSQELTFWRHAPQVRMAFELDWKGQDARAVVRFPTAWTDLNTGVFEIPFGVVERSTYPNRFYARENQWPAQNWAALCRDGLVFALYNQGLGGTGIKDGELTASLMRSITYKGGWGKDMIGHPSGPGALANGPHRFELQFELRRGDWRDLDLARRGKEFNARPLARAGVVRGPSQSIAAGGLSIEPSSIVATAFKPAEDVAGGVILRLYESVGRATSCRVRVPGVWGFVSRWVECDLMERPSGPPDVVTSKGIELEFAPFEIKTILLER